MEDLLDLQELCAVLNISVPNAATVYRWRQNGMPYVKIGRKIRFNKDKVLAWWEQRSQTENK